MTRYKLRVDSIIGPITVTTVGTSFSHAWNKLKKETAGVTKLIQIISENKCESKVDEH